MSGVKTAQFDSTNARLIHTICSGCVMSTIPVLNIAVRTILHHLYQRNTVMTQLLDGLYTNNSIIVYTQITHNILISIYLLLLIV